ncbi:MAG: hypothetical protein AB8B55_23295 [Mariniblastus sp.]
MDSQLTKRPSLKKLSPRIATVLGQLRRRIRLVVLVEGFAIAIAWLVITFWAALALDYLPVMFGLPELSQVSRGIILAGVSILIGGLAYRYILCRTFVRLKDESLAILIERRYPQFNDSLLTTVGRTVRRTAKKVSHESSCEMEVPVDEAMLEQTKSDAESHISNVNASDVINSGPLKRSLIIAGILLLSVGGLAIAQPDNLKIAGKRLYLLDDIVWPRQCRIEMVGIKVKRENAIEGITELGKVLTPKSGEFRIAKGSTLTLMVRAEDFRDVPQNDPDIQQRKLPNACFMNYETADGNRGSQTFKKIGAPRDGFQLYSLDGQPLRGILGDISFTVRGGDHRVGPFNITVVDEPSVLETKLGCKFPEYIVDQSSMRWTDRTIQWSGQARLPEGTKLTVQAKTNKPLTKVYALDRNQQTIRSIDVTGSNFNFELPALTEPVNLQFFLCDEDGLVSEQPHNVMIEPIEDQAPNVKTRITGIGTAVTPNVQIPFSGSILDDYGLNQTWMEIEIANSEPISESVSVATNGDLQTVLDFKERVQTKGNQYQLPIEEGSTVSLVVKSDDKFDLKQSPNLGIGDRYVLDVVAPNQLVRILERQEVGQRRRLEQIYIELADARNYLLRAKSKRDNISSELVEPGDQPNLTEPSAEDRDEGSEPRIRKQELQLLFAQRAILQIEKSTQEIFGSSEAFENIRLQLINNRIDSEDRKKRISEQIIAPLRLIANNSMQQLKEQVVDLETGLRNLQLSPQDTSIIESTDSLAIKSIEMTDAVLGQLEEVLNVMVKYETQNELLEIVRQMIKRQQAIMERTKKERQNKAFDGLLD